MNRQSFSKKLTRRQFLRTGGIGLLSMAAGYGQVKPFSFLSKANSPTPIASAEEAADTILLNGKVFTVDQANTETQAVAIKNGLIQAVGKDREIALLTGEKTRVIELDGKAVSPGFIDPHVHFRVIGLDYLYYQPFLPPDVRDVASLQTAIADIAGSKPEGEWIQGYYLALADNMFPDRYDLDAASADHPIWIMHIGGHWGCANSAAIQLAGITAATPSPEGGIIEKDADGEPTGVFYNHRAMDVLRRVAPPITSETLTQAILNTQPVMAACGVTSYQDNNVRGLDQFKAYQDLAKQGKLYLRSSLYLTLEWPEDIEKVDQVEYYQDDYSRVAGYKFLIDGQVPTAYCHQPHNGISWDLPTWDPENFKSVVRTLHDTGLQICTHCFGDAAADLALDAYEAAMNANPRSDPRHRLEHLVLTTSEATRRMRDLGVIASANPHFIYVAGDSYANNFGENMLDRIIVTREWLDNGVHLTIGSDAPSVPFHNPQATMAGSMSRLTFKKNVISPDQCLTFTEALRAHTIEAAYAGHEEQIKGSLEPGKLADLIVWNEDPSRLRIGELFSTTTVAMTMVGGKIVHPA